MAAVWPDTVVEESNLSQNIYTLRRALAEERGENRYIATVPGRGYRFIAVVNVVASEPDPEVVPGPTLPGTDHGPTHSRRTARPRSRTIVAASVLITAVLALIAGLIAARRQRVDPQSPPLVRTVAVLPFKPLVMDTRDESLELGMADSVIAKLSAVRQITVPPLSAVRQYGSQEQDLHEAGRRLGVDAVVDGSIQRWGDRVRVTVRLVRIADRKQLWSGQFDQTFTDIFAVQDSISERVVRELAVELTSDERSRLAKHHTGNPEAYELYLKGRYFWGKRTREGTIKAISYYEKALEHDPRYALAYTGLADAYRGMPIRSDVPSADAFPKAKEAALRALAIDNGLAEAHTALGWILFFHEWQWAQSLSEFGRALAINPHDSLAQLGSAHVLLILGRREEALRAVDRGLHSDPLSPHAGTMRAMVLLCAGQRAKAVEQLRDTLEIDPTFWIAHLFVGDAYLAESRYEEALEAYQKAEKYSGGISQTTSLIGYVHAKAGRRTDAEQYLRKLEGTGQSRYVSPYYLALLHLALGHSEQALRYLDRAYEERDVHMVFIKVDPKWDPLRTNLRFVQLTEAMNLPAK
jgi:tetratricopeptide (TPR) repeat protein